MKKIYLLILLPFLAGCAVQHEDYFEKDALCQNYISNIKDDVTQRDNGVSSHNDFSAFYSPVLEQCVVSFTEYYDATALGGEEYTVYNYLSADRESLCIFKYGSTESRILCSKGMYYNKNASEGNEDIEITKGAYDDSIITYQSLEGKYLRGEYNSQTEAEKRAIELLKQ